MREMLRELRARGVRVGEHGPAVLRAIDHGVGVHRGVLAAQRTQLVACAEQTRQHGAGRKAELGRDLRGGVAHEHLQNQGLAVLLGQLEQGGAQLRQILIVRGREHRLLACDELVHVDRREPLALEAARVFAPDDGQEPGLGGRFVLQRAPCLPRPQQRLLDDVFRQCAVPGQPECETQEIRAQRLT